MTYPPQGPYGQQPDPYGQQQYGGYQQQPADQYGQYGGGFPSGQYGGLGGPPPPKKNTGPIIAVVIIVVLLLGGLGITGFVAPGFFLSSDEGGNNAGGGNSSTSAKPKGTAADDFIDELITAAGDQDQDALEEMTCSDAESIVDDAIESIEYVQEVSLEDTKEVSDDEVTAELAVTVEAEDGSEEGTFEATVVKDGDDWCWNDLSTGSIELPTGGSEPTDDTPTDDTEPTDPGGDGSEGVVFLEDFLAAVNAGDHATATSMMCSDTTSQGDLDSVVPNSPSLQIEAGTEEVDSYHVWVDLVGTVGGEEVIGGASSFLEEEGWCVYTFFAI